MPQMQCDFFHGSMIEASWSQTLAEGSRAWVIGEYKQLTLITARTPMPIKMNVIIKVNSMAIMVIIIIDTVETSTSPPTVRSAVDNKIIPCSHDKFIMY